MRVMCVKSSPAHQAVAILLGGSFPEIGDKCTVIETKRCSCGKHDVYYLEEHWLPTGFPTEFFATLPEADADEIEAAEKEAIVPNPNL